MAIPTDIKYIVTDPEIYGGRPIIAGHRIAVEFPLTLAQIHAALAYYYDNREALDHQLAEDEARLAAYAEQDHSPIMERLRSHRLQ